MLHTAGSSDIPSKEKIEPFLNKLLVKFQSAFYPYEEVSIDEMAVKL